MKTNYSSLHLRALLLISILNSSASSDETSPTTHDSIARVAIYDHSDGNASGPQNLMQFLTSENGIECQRVSPKDIQTGMLNNFDVLIMPGGSGSLQSKKLEETGRKNVIEFVESGGGYVGICAGSYLATSQYSWSLGLVNARVWDRVHWARGTGNVTLSMTPSGLRLLNAKQAELFVYYGQGPLLAPDTKAHLPGYEVLASYKTEVVSKGAPEGSMVGTHAIIRTMYKNGRVICFSPHPEKQGGPQQLMTAAVKWAANGIRPPKPTVSTESRCSPTQRHESSVDPVN